VIPPWDVGVRIRLGKVAARLEPGPHLRIPILDDVVLVNTRTRLITAPSISVTGENGKIRVTTAAISYRIADPVRAMLSYQNSEHAVMLLVQSRICRILLPASVLEEVRAELAPKGIDVQFIEYTENVEVRTYRLLNDGWKAHGLTEMQPVRDGGCTRW